MLYETGQTMEIKRRQSLCINMLVSMFHKGFIKDKEDVSANHIYLHKRAVLQLSPHTKHHFSNLRSKQVFYMI